MSAFDRLVKKLAEKKGVRDARAIAAKVGMEKYGKAGMEKKAEEGREKKEGK